MKPRLESLDAIRFIAASLVLISHLFEVFIVPMYGWDSILGYAVNWVGIMSVICFFYLSGYVIAFATDYSINNDKYSLSNYCKKRFFRIYPVVWGVLIYSLIIVFLMKLLHLNGLTEKGLYISGDVWSEPNYIGFKYFMYSVFLPPSGFNGGFFNLPLWTVSYEMAFYILYGFIVSSLLRYGVIKTIVFIVFVMGMLLTWYVNMGLSTDSVGFVNILMNFLSNFPCWYFQAFFIIWMMGVGCFYFSKKKIVFDIRFVTLTLLTSLLSILIFYYIFNIPLSYMPYPDVTARSCLPYTILMTISYSLPLLTFVYIMQFIKLPKILSFLGFLGKKYSYTLYASHFILLNFTFGMLSPYLRLFGWAEFMFMFVILYLLANIIAYYLAKVLENRNYWMGLAKRDG